VSQQRWQGIASYYHPKFNGRKTSTGEIFSNTKLTAANNFLKLGTLVRIVNPKNGKSVVVKINDRMNAKNKRLIDLSQAAAEKLGLIQQGIGEVVMEVFPGETDYISTR
jgi:rare lipoprotein A